MTGKETNHKDGCVHQNSWLTACISTQVSPPLPMTLQTALRPRWGGGVCYGNAGMWHHSTLMNVNYKDKQECGPDFWKLKHLLVPTALMSKVKGRGLFQSFWIPILQTFWLIRRYQQHSLGSKSAYFFFDLCTYASKLLTLNSDTKGSDLEADTCFYILSFLPGKKQILESWNTCQEKRECLKLSNRYSLRQVSWQHIILTADIPYSENAGTHLKTASGTLETYLFIEHA